MRLGGGKNQGQILSACVSSRYPLCLLLTKKILYEAILHVASQEESAPLPQFIDVCKERRLAGALNKRKERRLRSRPDSFHGFVG